MSQEIQIPRPVRKARVSVMDEIGSSGLKAYGGYVYEEFLPQLTGENALKVYREMKDNDPIVAAILFAIDMLVRQVDWHVEPASSDNEDLRAAKFLDDCINDMTMPWKDVVSESLTMLPYGFSFMEIVDKQRDGYQGEGGDSSRFDDGRIGWKKFAHRPQDSLYRWAFDETGGVRAMLQITQPDYRIATIPIEKGLLFRTVASKNNPSGRSVLRGAYRPWYFKKRIEEIEAIGIERDLAGLPIAMVDPSLLRADADDDDKALLNSIKELVVNVRRDQQEGVIFPMSYDDNGRPLFDFKLMTSGGARQFNIESVIDRYSKQIAMTVMADFIFLGHQGTGSYALSSDKTGLFAKSLGVWLGVIQDTFNRYAVPRLLRVNNMSLEKMPRMVHGDIETPNLMELSDYVTKLAGIGIPATGRSDGVVPSWRGASAAEDGRTHRRAREASRTASADATDADATDGCPDPADAGSSRCGAVRTTASTSASNVGYGRCSSRWRISRCGRCRIRGARRQCGAGKS